MSKDDKTYISNTQLHTFNESPIYKELSKCTTSRGELTEQFYFTLKDFYIKSQATEKELAELKEKYIKTAVDYLYLEDMETMSFEIVDEKPSFVNEKRKQHVDREHELFKNEEYVIQSTGFEIDDYYGKIARKFVDNDKWIVIDYTC